MVVEEVEFSILVLELSRWQDLRLARGDVLHCHCEARQARKQLQETSSFLPLVCWSPWYLLLALLLLLTLSVSLTMFSFVRFFRLGILGIRR